MVYGFTPKRLRKGKVSSRAFKAIFCSKDEGVLSTFRVMPFEARDGRWKLLKTVVVGKMIVADGVFPLRANPAIETSFQRCDEAWKRVFSVDPSHAGTVMVSGADLEMSDSLEFTAEENSTDEQPKVDDVVGRMTDSTGVYAYEIIWKGYDRGDLTWHYAADLKNCTRLVAEFEARIAARGESDEIEVYAPRLEVGDSAMASGSLGAEPYECNYLGVGASCYCVDSTA